MPGGKTSVLGITWPDLDEIADGPNAFQTMAQQVQDTRVALIHDHLWSNWTPTTVNIGPGASGPLGNFGQGFTALTDGWAEFELDVFIGTTSATVFGAGLVRIGMHETAAGAAVQTQREHRFHNHAKTAGWSVHTTARLDITRGMTTVYAVPRVGSDPTSSPLTVYEVNCRLTVYGHTASS